ncbi:MAG: hypothetical protein ABIP48_09990 [Planctomycetota bacterium]
MKTLLTSLVAALAVCLALGAEPTQAVGPPESAQAPHESTYLAQVYWPPYGYYHASTPAESYARGAAAWARARAEFNLRSSQARINRAEARRYELENQIRATETYFKMRLMNREYRAELRGPRPTPEQMKRLAAAGKPAPLSPSELDSITGEIAWPILLRDDRYADHRAQLEALFAERASADELSTTTYLKIDRTTKAMLAVLKNRITRVPQMDYIAAKRFIQSLAYEARQPTS